MKVHVSSFIVIVGMIKFFEFVFLLVDRVESFDMIFSGGLELELFEEISLIDLVHH